MTITRAVLFIYTCFMYSSLTLAGSPFVVAHRGDEQLFPENSSEAFLSAATAKADYIEMDIRRTADGVLVIHHDESTGRSVQCSEGEVGIAQTTALYLKTACRYRAASAGQEQILTLEETLELMRWTNAGLVLDVKPDIRESEMNQFAHTLIALDPQGSCLQGIDPGGTFNCFSSLIIYVNNLTAHDKLWRMAKGLEKSEPAFKALAKMKFLKIVYSAKDALMQPEKYLDNDGIAFNLLNSSTEDTIALRRNYPNKILAGWTLENRQQFQHAETMQLDGVIVSRLHDYLEFLKVSNRP